MNEQELKTRIHEAWKAHYAGDHAAAVERFKEIVAQVPDHIDANWGLALSYRGQGQREEALAVFQKVKTLVAVQIEGDSGERERYFMLNRMVVQQIEQMADFI